MQQLINKDRTSGLFYGIIQPEGDILKVKKTNAMRLLDQKKIPYQMHFYDKVKLDQGISLESQIKRPMALIYKTIVLEADHDYFVGVVPIESELNLKKTASAFGVKKVNLLHLKDLTKVTGYVRGGCSPVGMKKEFPTIIDQSALALDTMIVSAGKIGSQLEVSPLDLAKVTKLSFADIQQG